MKYDLIYDNSAKEEFAERFPKAKIEDATDEIHDSRFAISFDPKIRDDVYYKWVIKNGHGPVSFAVQLMLAGREKEDMEKLKKWLDEIEKEDGGVSLSKTSEGN